MTDLSDIGKAAGTMSHAEFRAAFDPADIVVLRGEVNYDESSAYHIVVLRALASRSAPDRVAIVTDLLDHGWVTRRGSPSTCDYHRGNEPLAVDRRCRRRRRLRRRPALPG